MEKIILASGSPRRKQLLEWAEVPFEVLVTDADESFTAGDDPARVAMQIASRKAYACREKMDHAGLPILAADTIVVLGNRIIGKPTDRSEAIAILKDLAGNTHKVITGVSILYNGSEHCFSDSTSVEFHPLTDEEISFYVDNYKPYDKAGAYAIQEWIGVVGIKCITGDFYNVMGLPVSRVVAALKALDRK